MGKAGNGQQDLFLEAPIWDEGLTGRQRRFVECYCADRGCFLNATAAFKKAYGNSKKALADSSIQSNASRLMRDPKIKAAVAKLLRSRQNEEDQINEFKMLETMALLAFYNPGEIVDKYGNLIRDLGEMGSLALCVTGIKRGKDGSREVKLFDRSKAMAMLSEYLKLIRPPEGAVIVNPNVYICEKDLEGASRAAPAAEEAEYEVLAAGA